MVTLSTAAAASLAAPARLVTCSVVIDPAARVPIPANCPSIVVPPVRVSSRRPGTSGVYGGGSGGGGGGGGGGWGAPGTSRASHGSLSVSAVRVPPPTTILPWSSIAALPTNTDREVKAMW